jgi:hypothetical protein
MPRDRRGPDRDLSSRVRSDRHDAALGSVGYENETNEKGERLIWLERAVVDRLRAMRGDGQSFSDVILRLAAGARLEQE